MCWPLLPETSSVCYFHSHYRMTILSISCTSNVKIPVNLHAQLVMDIQNIKAIGTHNLPSKQVRFHHFKSKSMMQKFHLQNGDNSKHYRTAKNHRCKSVLIMGYADDINVLARSRMAVNEVHTVWENEAITIGLNIITEKKTKATVQNRKQMREKRQKDNPFK